MSDDEIGIPIYLYFQIGKVISYILGIQLHFFFVEIFDNLSFCTA